MTLSLPARLYTDRQVHRDESTRLFARSWQLVGHLSQLRNQSAITADLLGHPLMLTRDDSGQLRVMSNVCRHRAGPLAPCPAGRRQLSCRYHGWQYDLTGQCISAPEMGDNPDFDPSQYRLPQLRHALWHGLIFATLDADAVPLDQMLSGLSETVSHSRPDAFIYHHRDHYDLACNWKVYMDNYLEGYHIPHIHPELNRMLDYRSYQTDVQPWYSCQHSPMEQTDGLYGTGQAWYVTLFPNTMLNLYPSRMQTNSVVPLAEDRCRVYFDYYYQNPDDPQSAEWIARDLAFSDEVQHEDIEICERVQQGLASGSYQHGPLNRRRESGVLHFQSLYRRLMNPRELAQHD